MWIDELTEIQEETKKKNISHHISPKQARFVKLKHPTLKISSSLT
jgi:hypothetical protein